MKLNAFFLGTITTSLLVVASNANALLISPTGYSTGNPAQPTYQAEILESDSGQSFTLDWIVPAGTNSTLPVDLTASILFSIDDFTTNSLGLDTLSLGINIANTTDLSAYPEANSAILSFGFGVEPDATASLITAGSTFDGIGAGTGPQQTYPGDFKNIDVCVFAFGCSGGDVSLGLQAGETDSLAIMLTGNFDQNGTANGAATLFDFPLKFQGTWGSFETPGTKVPEPSSLLLMGIGLAGLGFTRRKKKAC
jgi:hypothetical protein